MTEKTSWDQERKAMRDVHRDLTGGDLGSWNYRMYEPVSGTATLGSERSEKFTDYKEKWEKAQNYVEFNEDRMLSGCLLYTSPSPRDRQKSRMPSSA